MEAEQTYNPQEGEMALEFVSRTIPPIFVTRR